MCGRKLKKKGRKKSNAFSLVHVSTHKKKKERCNEGHLRDCPIDQVDEWCLARRDATALLI